MRDKSVGIALAIMVIFFGLVWAQTNGFSSQPVASSNVTVQGAAPTVNDDITRGYFPGYVWIDQSGPGAYIAISTGDGSADWNRID